MMAPTAPVPSRDRDTLIDSLADFRRQVERIGFDWRAIEAEASLQVTVDR